jgi:hypothetical protein
MAAVMADLSRSVGEAMERVSIQNTMPAIGAARISLSEVLSALSYALDLTEGSPPGHTLRSCMVGMRMAEALGLGEDE